MTSIDKNSRETDKFSPAREQFEKLVSELTSEKSQSLEHGDIENLIEREGAETLRRLFQAHLDLRAVREEKKR